MLYNIVILYMEETDNSRTGQNIKKKLESTGLYIHTRLSFLKSVISIK